MKTRYRILLVLIVLLMLNGCVNTKLSHLRHGRFHQKDRDLATIKSSIQLPEHPLKLREIVDIALAHNLDLRVKAREYAIQHERATGERLKTLPSLTFSAEHSYRNENTASFSVNATTGEISTGVDPITGQPLPPGSIGSSQWVNRWDITAAYNIIDFGLSYLRARQEINRAVSVCFQLQRAQQNIILDIYKAYWKTLAAQKALAEAKKIMKTSEKLQQRVDQRIKQKYIPNISGLNTEIQLVSIRNRMLPIEKRYIDGKVELAALMGLTDHNAFELEDIEITESETELADIETLEGLALVNRPELYSTDSEFRIFKDEVRAAIVEMFPNTSLFLGRNFDGDFYLLEHNWTLSGVRTAWNLLALPQRWYAHKEAKERLKLAKESRLALSLGVVSQVNLAYYAYLDTKKNLKNANEGSDINSRMLYIASRQRDFGALDGIDIINFDANALESYYQYLTAYGDNQIALELVNNAIGMPMRFGSENDWKCNW